MTDKAGIKEQGTRCPPSRGRLLVTLFFSTLRLSAFTFGGGAVIVSLMRKGFCDDLRWVDDEKMLDMIAIAQSSPGPVVVNASLALGFHLAGLPGALVALMGTIIPPIIIISLVTFFYDQLRHQPLVGQLMRGMQAGVAAVITKAVFDMGQTVVKQDGMLAFAFMAAAFALVYVAKWPLLVVIALCALAGVALYLIRRRKAP